MRKMNKTGAIQYVCASVLIMLCFYTEAFGATSPQPLADGLAADQVSVRELMRLETAYALKLARARVDVPMQTDMVKRPSAPMNGKPTLTAIYGVGRHLMAEVVIDQERLLYRRGQVLPVGVAAGDTVFLLQEISASCITLQRAQESQRLCLTVKARTSP